MNTSLSDYLIRHTGTIGRMKRDSMPALIAEFETYLVEYYTALHKYNTHQEQTSALSDPRAHQFNVPYVKAELQRIVTGVCDAVRIDLSTKKIPGTQEEIKHKLDEFRALVEEKLFHVISRLPHST